MMCLFSSRFWTVAIPAASSLDGTAGIVVKARVQAVWELTYGSMEA